MKISKKICLFLCFCFLIMGKSYGAAPQRSNSLGITTRTVAAVFGSLYCFSLAGYEYLTESSRDEPFFGCSANRLVLFGVFFGTAAWNEILAEQDREAKRVAKIAEEEQAAEAIRVAQAARAAEQAERLAEEERAIRMAQEIEKQKAEQAAEAIRVAQAAEQAERLAEEERAIRMAQEIEKQKAEQAAEAIRVAQAAEQAERLAEEERAIKMAQEVEKQKVEQAAEKTRQAPKEKQREKAKNADLEAEKKRLEAVKTSNRIAEELLAEEDAELARDAKRKQKKLNGRAKKAAKKALEALKPQMQKDEEEVKMRPIDAQMAAIREGKRPVITVPLVVEEQVESDVENECNTCLEECEPGDWIKFKTCDHGMCRGCAQDILQNSCGAADATLAKCPSQDCHRAPFTEYDIEAICSDNDSLKHKYNSLLSELEMARLLVPESSKIEDSFQSEEKMKECPNCKVAFLIKAEGSSSGLKRKKAQSCMKCPHCRQSICGSCYLPSHKGQTCHDAGIQAREAATQIDTDDVKACPTCKNFAIKGDGCQFIKCGRTLECNRVEFCWYCKKTFPRQRGHTSHTCADGELIGTAYGQTLQEARARMQKLS